MGTMKVKVYYNDSGRIVSCIEIKDKGDVPPTGILHVPGYRESEIELSEDQARLPLIALHVGYSVDFSGARPRLVPLVPPKGRQTRKRQSK